MNAAFFVDCSACILVVSCLIFQLLTVYLLPSSTFSSSIAQIVLYFSSLIPCAFRFVSNNNVTHVILNFIKLNRSRNLSVGIRTCHFKPAAIFLVIATLST